jgi:hypothetical protein
MKVPAIDQLMQRVRRTPLQRAVIDKRICPQCHKRSLVPVASSPAAHTLQCFGCLALFASCDSSEDRSN